MRIIERGDVMRLTYKEKEDYYSHYESDALDKLGQLEDVEDELGIDLITLFKALKNAGVYVKNGFTEDTAIKMRSFQICGDDSGITIWSRIRLNAKDYGITWALTRKELENE